MGEAILQNLILKERLENVIKVSSAGLLGIIGEPASDYSIVVAGENGLDLEAHRSKGISSEIMNDSDLVLCMTIDHAEKLKYQYPALCEKIYTLKEYLTKGDLLSYSIEDPIGLSLDYYRKVFSDIKIELERIFPELKKMAQS
jgi:protein-tyrosine-phosphatase